MNFLKKISLKYFACLLLVAGILFSGVRYVKAQDTVSTEGIEFTEIPSAADSLAAARKAYEEKKQVQIEQPAAEKTNIKQPKDTSKTLWEVFLTGLGWGFAAVLMPCIYPMLPLTVSFFTKLGGSRSKAIGFSLAYGLSIITIYVSLGLVLAAIFGPDVMNSIATNGIFNGLIFLLLIVFAISFLGAFEITLPSSLVNKIDEQSNRGGIIGMFFMALTLVVVSFSCTGPVVGSALATAFTKGEWLAPAATMFGFSLALAIPFTLFSLFPSWLKSLPKSGGWLNSVKVILGFIELALSLKFLSNIDLAYHWNWFDREVFLSLWIAIFFLMGLYLIGKIKFSHDSPLPHLSVLRTFLAVIVFAFVAYMVPGLWGAPLKSISALLPPTGTQDFYLSDVGSAPAATQKTSAGQPKYASIFERAKIKGINSWYDYEQALQVSKELKKPIMIDFTGWNCVNCREMEADVWHNPEVFKRLRDEYVLLQLYVDDKTELQPEEVYKSDFSGKKITNLGAKWSDLQAKQFNTNSQPFYVLLDSDGNLLTDSEGKTIEPSGAEFNVSKYIKFLDSGIAAYKNKQ